jgi:putative hydrolase of the HAD superfamily
MVAPLANIKAITLDAGGTLVKPWPSVGHVYAGAAAGHCVRPVSADLLNQRFARAWRKLKNFNHRREEWAALVDETFAGLTEQPPSETFFPELYRRFAEPEAWRIYEDVLPALDMLASRGINLGIISNWDERLLPLLEQLGLRKRFEVAVVSCEVGFPKPSPVIFGHAVRKLGEAPESVLHVGDDPDHDFEGAKAAGLQALLLERGAETRRAGSIASLLELERLIG